MLAIDIHNLRKRYGAVEAVRAVSLQVEQGEIFGLLGPNGAGKTTTTEILEGLRTRDGGDVRVLGLDPSVAPRALKARIGVCLQSTNLPDKLRVGEAVDLFASFYPRARPTGEVLAMVGLTEKRRSFYAQLSGGQKQRLALGLTLVSNPELIFLDEPTAGLDAHARHQVHGFIEAQRQSGRSVFLTTHYIEEAERLCDRVAIVHRGEIVATGTPREIRARAGGATVEIRCEQPIDAAAVERLPGVERVVAETPAALIIRTGQPARTVIDLVHLIEAGRNPLVDLHITRPSLEDVFIELTGEAFEDAKLLDAAAN